MEDAWDWEVEINGPRAERGMKALPLPDYEPLGIELDAPYYRALAQDYQDAIYDQQAVAR